MERRGGNERVEREGKGKGGLGKAGRDGGNERGLCGLCRSSHRMLAFVSRV